MLVISLEIANKARAIHVFRLRFYKCFHRTKNIPEHFEEV